MRTRLPLLLIILLWHGGALGQQSLTVVQGGWASIVGQDPVKSSGYRFAVGWEFFRADRPLSLGLTFGGLSMSGTRSSLGMTQSFKLTSIPIYAVTRLTFGAERLNGFVRVGAGGHYSTFTHDDFPSAGGQWGASIFSSAGIMYWINKKIFLGCDFEWLWLSNTMPNMGTVGVASFSAGLKL